MLYAQEQRLKTSGHREDARPPMWSKVRDIEFAWLCLKIQVLKQPNTQQYHVIKREKKFTHLKYANKNLGYYILPSLKEFRPEIHHNLQGKMREKLK